MRKQIALPLLFIGLLFYGYTSAQVKIGNNPQTIDPASVLELESTERVLVITRVDSLQMAGIVPSRGALVYNTSADCVFYYNGTAWINLCTGATSGNFTTEPIANVGGIPTIVITPTATGNNFEVAPNSISSDQITNGSIFAEDLNLGALDGGALVPNSITRDKLSENSVGPFALDRDSLPLSFFENDAGFITGADVVSGDANNVIVAGSDGGAFYDDSDLQMALDSISANNAGDNDQDATNEIQDLVLDPATNELSLSLSSEDPIDLNSLAHTGTPNSIFFAGTDGKPTDTFGNEYILDNGGLYWDPTKRYNTGALYVGLKTGVTSEGADSPVGQSFQSRHCRTCFIDWGKWFGAGLSLTTTERKR